jgi:hypothetical protein
MGNHRPPQLFFFYFSVKLVIFIFLDFYSDASFSSSFPFFLPLGYYDFVTALGRPALPAGKLFHTYPSSCVVGSQPV